MQIQRTAFISSSTGIYGVEFKGLMIHDQGLEMIIFTIDSLN